MFYSPAFTFSSIYPLGFCRVPGFALGCCAIFKRFWPLALVQQALPAIILKALRRLRGAVLFRSLRPSSSWGFPCWLLGLTVQSSRPAFGGRLTLAVRKCLNLSANEQTEMTGTSSRLETVRLATWKQLVIFLLSSVFYRGIFTKKQG